MADDQTTTVYHDPAWIASAGAYLHPNNVLWYFAQSPFFEKTSQNQELITQYGGTPLEGRFLGTKKGWHDQLRMRRGVSYVVHHDPIETNTQFDGPQGKEQSNVWVIRKQRRDEPQDESSVRVLGYYFILNDAIYEAPSMASVLSTRMLNTTTALKNLFSTASELPIFSAAHGHTYKKPTQKPISQSQPEIAPQSKEVTPAPTQESSAADKDSKSGEAAVPGSDQDSWILDFALKKTMRFGKEFSDDKPLAGEPGKLRYSATKEQPALARGTEAASSMSRGPTPMYSRAGSTAPK